LKKYFAYIILLLMVFTSCKSKKMAMLDPPKAVAVNPATGESPRTIEEQLMLTQNQKKGKKRQYAKDKYKAEKQYKKEVAKYQKTKNSKASRKLIKINKRHARKYRKRFHKRRRFFLWRWLRL